MLKKPFKIGDKVKCYYGDAGHKFWTHLLEPFAIITKVRKVKNEDIYRLQFEGDNFKDNWFYSNDFYIIKEIKVNLELPPSLKEK